jgi:hypothetical protein
VKNYTMERRYLDKYSLKDKLGYGTKTRDGIWRPLDVQNGQLVVEGTDIFEDAQRLEVLEQRRKMRDWRMVIELARHGRIGRPRKNPL